MNSDFGMFSFSTSWNGGSCKNGKELIYQILDMGFTKAELNYSVTGEMYNDILDLVNQGKVEISSVHHPFPKCCEEGYSIDSLMLGYIEQGKRDKAINVTRNTIDHAVELGAKAVVIHPTEVPVAKDKPYDKMLKKLYNQGKRKSKEYSNLFNEMINYRQSKNMIHLNLMKESLESLCDYILKKNYKIRLGIENRANCHQIPDFNEINILLKMLKGLPVYFWYDIGHGVMMDRLGLYNNLEEANKITDKMIGIHIHNTVGLLDHLAPYINNNDLDNYIEIIKKVPIKVLELACYNSCEDIIKGTRILADKIKK